ncbi:hypothetical protein Tco_0533169 [Tanacetum coccineum]
MEDEFYHLTVKGNDLNTYVRRFQELATLCPTMVPNFEKMMEVFIGGLPRMITNESLTTEELSTTTTTVTPTPTTATIITNHNRTETEDRKPSGPCTVKCNTCNKVGHLTKNYKNKEPTTEVVLTQKINMAYPLPLDTAYRSSVIESESKKYLSELVD